MREEAIELQPSTDIPKAILPEALPAGPAERFAYSYGVGAGELLHISGLVSLSASGEIVGVDDVGAQATQVFENMRAVVETAGGTLDDLVSTTTYMTDVSFSAAINEVRIQYLTGLVKPTSTLLVVAGLARPEFLVEIAAVAIVRS